MDLLWIGLGVLLWVGCGVISAGYSFAFLQGAFPEIAAQKYEEDRRFALFDLCTGPFGLLATYVLFHTKYGWQWPRRKK